MHAPNAKITRIMDLAGRSANRRLQKRRLGVKELFRMPCLLPAIATVALGLLTVLAGAGMAVVGYVPANSSHNTTKPSPINNNTVISQEPHEEHSSIKVYAYIGPFLMAIGIFAMITACVFYCEVLDKYAILVPDKRGEVYSKEELYTIIVGEMKKSYAQTLITAYTKAAEESLLAESSSVDYISEPSIFPCKVNEPLTLEQQIDIECEGYTPSPPIPNKRYSIIQARIQRLKSEDNWLKTSSLPNIRRIASIKRAGRVGPKITDTRTLSCDYTMDEARLRRKSMMLRTIVQWNSGSSDLFAQRQRRFSSAKALPSEENEGSMDDMSQKEFGSFPLTRLIQRRGTFACGDMRTRRMKFLLLLEASESQEGFNDPVSADGRQTVAGIRRNSFIPYTTCDKFIAGEEKKTIRDRRRSSVNPFSLRSRFGPPNVNAPQAGIRRHSFYPIRRDTRIYSQPIELRRHSFNPVGVSNTLKSEFAAKMDARRISINPESFSFRPEERRLSHVPQQTNRFLQVPGFDPSMEARPSTTANEPPPHSASDPGFPYRTTGGAQSFQDDRLIDRRHSFNPVVRLSTGGGDSSQLTVPKIAINEETSERFLTVPSHDYYIEERERRHSVNVTPSRAAHSIATSSKLNEKPNPQRISFKLEPSVPSGHLAPSLTQTVTRSTLKLSKPATARVRPSSFKQEMVIFRPLKQSDSRSGSPCSNTSCCGSEKVESEHSCAVSRTASVSSDRSAKTTLNVSPVPAVAGENTDYGPFKQAASFHDSSECIMLEDTHSNIPQTLQFLPNRMKVDIPLATAGFCKDSGIERKSAFRYTGGLVRTLEQHVDTPGSTNSGPAAFSAPVSTNFSATMHRSKSASALAGADVMRSASPRATINYARVPKPSSPLVARHKTQHYSNKKFS